jgi:spermidine/putrescine transport system ATP-binding protein
VQVSLYPPDLSVNCFEGRLQNVMYLGTHVHYVVELRSGDRLTVMQVNAGGELPALNTPIYAYWSTADALAMSAA